MWSHGRDDKRHLPVSRTVTYYRDVVRFLEQNCVSCHRKDGIAPFVLDDIDQVQDRAKVIKRVENEGTMPPWFALAEQDSRKNPWTHDCILPSSDKADLLAWLIGACHGGELC